MKLQQILLRYQIIDILLALLYMHPTMIRYYPHSVPTVGLYHFLHFSNNSSLGKTIKSL